jgi:hypothetical protein
MNETEALQVLSEFAKSVQEEAQRIRFTVAGGNYTLTKYRGLPAGSRPRYFAAFSWPSDRATGYFGFFTSRSANVPHCSGMVTSRTETTQLVATVNLHDLEEVIASFEIASNGLTPTSPSQPVPITAWLRTPERGLYEIPFQHVDETP